MKILINISNNPNIESKIGFFNAFLTLGHECILWNKQQKPAFDIFSEFEPELFIGHAQELDRALIKCLKQRPNLKTFIETKLYGRAEKSLPIQLKYLIANKNEINAINELKDCNLTLFTSILDDYLEQTHGQWLTENFKVISVPLGIDHTIYNTGNQIPVWHSKVSYYGNWNNEIEEWCLNLINANIPLKIFGDNKVSLPEYLGSVDKINLKNLYVSSELNLDLDIGPNFKYTEKFLNIMACGGKVISYNNESKTKLIPNLSVFNSTEELLDLISKPSLPSTTDEFIKNNLYTKRVETFLDN